MSKKVALLISLILILALSISSCNLIVKDPEVDKSTVIIEVAGQQVTKQEVQEAIEQQMVLESYYYQRQYGQKLDTKDSKIRETVTNNVLDSIIKSKVIDSKIEQGGYSALSAEEEASLKETVAAEYKKTLEQVKANHFANTELKDAELEAAVAAKAQELDYANEEKLYESRAKTKAYEKLKADVVKDISVADEEVKKEYDARVEKAKSSYASNPSLYNTNVLNNATIYYRPAGYRNVKHILIKLSDDDQTALKTIKNDIATKTAEIEKINKSIAELNAENEEDKAKIAELEESLKPLKVDLESLNTTLPQKEEASYAKLSEKVAEVEAKITAGEDFDKLMETYNEDPGMTRSPAKEEGYPVTAGLNTFDEAFVNAAMALEKIGDVSKAVKGSNGYHFIKYISDVTEGAVDFESLKETIKNELLTTAQNNYFNEQVDAWVKEANAKTYKDRLK